MTDSGGHGGDDDDGGDCGNNRCDPGETTQNCAEDCPAPMPCGNHVCDSGETPQSCPGDCPAVTCGDHVCGAGEQQSCPQDCPVCGNNVCEAGETATCPNDCTATLRVQNNSSYTIFHLYIRRCEVTEWGIDQLGANVISPGKALQISRIPPACYFFRATNAGSTVTWTTPAGVQLAPGQVYPWTLIN